MEKASKSGAHTGDADPLETLRPGVVIDGKYRVDRVLGRGGMGVVVAATHLALNERVALKFLRSMGGDLYGDFPARFAREARVCAKLKNDHIARVHDVGTWQGKAPFMVMDYVEGIDLREELKTLGRIPLVRAVDLTFQICEALAEAHALGIIHRDLKPANLIIATRSDGSELLKVLDFGVSKLTAAGDEFGELTKAGVMLGSPRYMAPEQLSGDDIDPRADVWSIGAILYRMLTGRPPYDYPQLSQMFMALASGARPTTPSSLEPTVPPALDTLLLRCLTRDREKRVPDVAELGGALLEAVGSPFASGARAHLSGLLERGGAPSNRSTTIPPSPMSTARHLALVVDSAVPVSMPDSCPPGSAPRRSAFRRARQLAAASACALIAVGIARTPGVRPDGAASSSVARPPPRTKWFVPKTLTPEPPTSLAIEDVLEMPDERVGRWSKDAE